MSYKLIIRMADEQSEEQTDEDVDAQGRADTDKMKMV